MRGQPSTSAGGTSVAVATAAAVPAANTSQAARSLPAPARAVIDLTLWNPYEEEDEEEEEEEILYRDDHNARRDGGQHTAASLATDLLDQRTNARDAQIRSHDEKVPFVLVAELGGSLQSVALADLRFVVQPSIARHRTRRSSTPLPEPDSHLRKRIKREESTSSSSTIVVSRSIRRDAGRAPPLPSSSVSLSSIPSSSSSSSSSAGPSSSSIQHRRSMKRESPASVSSSVVSRAIPTSSSKDNDDNDIEFVSISQNGTPLSSLHLPAHILQFCKEANVFTTERFLAYGLVKEEMGRFKELVEDWLEGQGRGRKATQRDFDGVVGVVKMERIFKSVRNR